MNFLNDFAEIVGDALIIALSAILIFMFVTIEVFGLFGQEANAVLRRVELGLAVPILLLGINRLILDIRSKR